MALADVAPWLACPRCARPLTLEGRTLTCDERHAYDVAKQGYVNLLGGAQPQHADTADMVARREEFLAGGHYAPVADAVAARLGDAQRVLDVGAGPGWYLARWLDDAHAPAHRVGLALDISTAAARRAARAHERIGAVVADTWAGLPVRDACVDAVTCVFAPRNLPEFTRVLRPGGLLVVVTPTPEHLHQARDRLGLLGVEEDKDAKLLRASSGLLDAVGQTTVRRTLRLDGDQLSALVQMGPNAFHAHAEPVAASSVTLAVTVSWFRKPNL